MAVKNTLKSKTVWFGISVIAFGLVNTLLVFLSGQGVIDTASGVGSILFGIVTIVLRYKTTIAIALGVDDPTTDGVDESKGERPKEGGFVTMRMLLVVLALALSMFAVAGCGTVFTAAKGDLVGIDIKPTTPAYLSATIAGAETCRINVPEGTISILNVCTAPLVSTMTPAGEPTCVENPCTAGTTLVFLSNGMTACQ